ncbi:30S ribosomal protein S9 [Candidatus Megaera venefica]|jgi:small subunit ribosomal protein S9|uniref:Small ribosomal subunit protein uS9 n=1 Tax=Candidatus Megaera venefica TaxID=2055910 RepID=A0ABU5NC76_9RICK|nr:30S ribosomal protein S9 [Candidatus Megaera venefica]MEA0970751.1 30S ribosomal protein S9 [Candidatus Megaera venefica]
MEVPTLEIKKSSVVANKIAAPQVVQCKSKKTTPDGGGYGTGRRKNSIARVWVRPGKGRIIVNNKDFSVYFPRETYRTSIMQPFVDTNTTGQFDVMCTTKGGGTTGQAGAIVHGIARALDCISTDFHAILRKGGFLTRDARVVERKKYGKRKARKSTQFSKR